MKFTKEFKQAAVSRVNAGKSLSAALALSSQSLRQAYQVHWLYINQAPARRVNICDEK